MSAAGGPSASWLQIGLGDWPGEGFVSLGYDRSSILHELER